MLWRIVYTGMKWICKKCPMVPKNHTTLSFPVYVPHSKRHTLPFPAFDRLKYFVYFRKQLVLYRRFQKISGGL